jgi:hypothetical protein
MNRKRWIAKPRGHALAALGLAALLLGAPGVAMAAAPQYAEQSDRYLLSSDGIVVELQGKEPMLHVRDPANESRSFNVELKGLAEVAPGLGSRAEVARLGFTGHVAWNASAQQTADGLVVTLHHEGPIDVQPRPAGGPDAALPGEVKNLTRGPSQANASVDLVFHVVDQDRTIQDGNATVNVTTREVKFDLVVAAWPWVSRSDDLALDALVTPPGAGMANATNDSANRVDVGNGTALGWFGWAPTATATTNGTAAAANVTVQHPGLGDAKSARVLLVYDAPGFDRLEHDHTVGMAPADGNATGSTTSTTARGTPGFELGLGAGAMALVAVAARRRRS